MVYGYRPATKKRSEISAEKLLLLVMTVEDGVMNDAAAVAGERRRDA